MGECRISEIVVLCGKLSKELTFQKYRQVGWSGSENDGEMHGQVRVPISES